MTGNNSDHARAIEIVDRLIEAFNKPDFEALSDLFADDIVFSHKNKGMEGKGKAQLLTNIRTMNDAFPGRSIGPSKRLLVDGDVIFRESYWTGKAAVDVPGFAAAGAQAYLDTATVLVVRDGRIAEWADFG